MKKCVKCNKRYNKDEIYCECCGRKLIDLEEVNKLMQDFDSELKKETAIFSGVGILFGGFGLGTVCAVSFIKRKERKEKVEQALDMKVNRKYKVIKRVNGRRIEC